MVSIRKVNMDILIIVLLIGYFFIPLHFRFTYLLVLTALIMVDIFTKSKERRD